MPFDNSPQGAFCHDSARASGAASVVPATAQIAPVRNNAKSVDQQSRKDTRLAAYKAKNTAANILRKQDEKLATLGKRVSHCRYVARADQVGLEKAGERARFDGLKSCNSVWCCPLCSARISAKRRDELNELLSGARSQGLAVVMLTLTASHKRGMNLPAWLEAFKDAKRRFRQRREWRALKSIFVGSVTATEVTHSAANSFHPHVHELLVLNCSADDALQLVEGLRDAWLASLHGQGLSGNDHAFQVQPASAAGEYVGKFGAAEELALSGAKSGRQGSRTPWQLLADAGDAENSAACQDAAIWAEFAAAFRGRRQLVWSPGLKLRFGIAEVSDDEVPDALPQEIPELLRVWPGSSDSWRFARRRSVALLHAAESGGDLNAAEFGPTDRQRWQENSFGSVVEREC